MKVLIIGLGSIAQKHISVLKIVEPGIVIYALRSSTNCTNEKDVTNIYIWEDIPENIDFIIISNPTSEHLTTIHKAIQQKVPLFIEKPPIADLANAKELIVKIKKNNTITYTAFSFRFHPVVKWLKENVSSKKIIEAQAYCGSYLPDWRQGMDYRKVYSANKILGGGVHLDLIHELDYIKYLFGLPKSVNSFLSKKSDLEIDSIDCAHYWLEYNKMNVSVILNYYRRDAKRFLELVCEDDTLMADFTLFKVTNSSGKVLFKTKPNVMIMYEEQMRYFINCIKTDKKPMNSIEESIQTLKICLT